MEIKELQDIIQQNGVVGAGGAGFPTYMKLTDKANTILMNCAECEPLLKLHRQLLEKHAYEIMKTFHMIQETVGASEAIIGIKKSYVQTIHALNQHIEEFPGMRLHLLDEVYPMGDEVVLIYEATGRVVRPGGLPIEQGVAVFNVETVYNIYRAVEEKQPVTDKYVSVVAEVSDPVTSESSPGMYSGGSGSTGRQHNSEGSCLFRRRPDDGAYRKWFRSGDKDNKCDFGPSKRPSYCSEEAADFFHRFKTCSIYLLPVQYLYRFMSET